MFALTYAFGLRVSAIELLDRENIDLQRERIRIHRLKGGLSGEGSIFRNLLPLLQQYLASRRDSDRALFVGRQGRLKRRQMQNLFYRYATEAGLSPNRRHVYVLRHSVAVHVLDAGEDIDFGASLDPVDDDVCAAERCPPSPHDAAARKIPRIPASLVVCSPVASRVLHAHRFLPNRPPGHICVFWRSPRQFFGRNAANPRNSAVTYSAAVEPAPTRAECSQARISLWTGFTICRC
jgi:hypothetical protein